MEPDVERCIQIIRTLAPEEANAISHRSLEALAQQIYRKDPDLAEQVKAKSDRFNPRAPIYLFIQEIVTYCCVIYSTIEVIGKIDHAATLLLDREAQVKIVDCAIEKLRLIGLEYPAQKIEELRDRVLDYLTKPQSK
ncbi:hypothetical protein IVA80_10355 [Bradyrhizobium sp. 139]|uniref:hypothetical protein n=1 Tax=Bradyrhizobium sp. 139 TaxID=2782616 RepID=UPI001FF7B7B5|nr:hypothetical protein [Bradyrhizobium sp. 139]MCK1741258.1 hypothetical protein [Bradyrhizobium sp. 139]